MKIGKSTNKSFEPCPEYSGQAVAVDVTPLKKTETQYGIKETFRIVFETKLLREDGGPCCVWSRGFTASLHEKAALSQFLRKWFGRPLTASEEEEFDTESLIGRTAEITVIHEQGRNGETYANIALIRPDRSRKPMAPSGKFVRAKDRQKDDDGKFNLAEQPAAQNGTDADWRSTKVHVGRHAGIDLGELDQDSVTALIEHWLPEAKAKAKPLADDKRLIAALEQAGQELTAASVGVEGESNDNIPY